MNLTFFNDKEGCGKSTLTLLVAKSLAELLSRGENTTNVYIFDTARNLKNSLMAKNNSEEIVDNKRLFIQYAENFENFEIQKTNLGIKGEDIVFFDLQNFGTTELDFISNSDFVFIVSDSPNELESIDRDMYNIINKLTDNTYFSTKKVFLTQNRVSEKEHIISEYEDINYVEGIDVLNEQWTIEKLKIYQSTPPKNVQRFALEIWKAINNQEKQVIL
ncbi:hypothetical protein [Capnocytophaga sputigena]|uniref:hypothetical protein n=1 Tax=Capnocytophaga sputigena TaxID=1019 RepID=UPI0028D57043|nr:hypothetical protein [Capnocytophaga sputigena]